jgi:hypothetical protein
MAKTIFIPPSLDIGDNKSLLIVRPSVVPHLLGSWIT